VAKNYHSDQEAWWATVGGDEHANGQLRTPADVDRDYSRLCGIKQSEMLPALIGPAIGPILEVGCGHGDQLNILSEHGYGDLWGVDISDEAVVRAMTHRRDLRIELGSAYDLPLSGPFAVVYTCGLLIHQPPEHVMEVIREILRVTEATGRICGVEYWTPEFAERIASRTWSGPYAALYQKADPTLRMVREDRYPMTGDGGIVEFFALERPSGS